MSNEENVLASQLLGLNVGAKLSSKHMSTICVEIRNEVFVLKQFLVKDPTGEVQIMTEEIWSKIQNWLYPKMIFMQQIQINNVIFGFRFDTPENNLLNFIILIVKKYI